MSYIGPTVSNKNIETFLKVAWDFQNKTIL